MSAALNSADTTFVDSGSSAVTSVSLAYAANISSGDLLVILIASDGDTGENGFTASGFTEDFLSDLTNPPGDKTANSAGLLLRKADGTETGSVTVAYASGSNQVHCAMIRISGPETSGTGLQAIDVGPANYIEGGSTTAPSSAGHTTTEADTLAVGFTVVDANRAFDAGPNVSPSTGWTDDHKQVSSSGSNMSLAICSKAMASAAATGSFTYTLAAADTWGVFTFSIRSAATGATVVLGQESVTAIGSVTQNHSLSMSGVEI